MCAHQADAPFLRGETPGPPPDLSDWEQPIFDQVSRHLPATPSAPVRIDRELDDGDELAFGGGAVAVAVLSPGPAIPAAGCPRAWPPRGGSGRRGRSCAAANISES